MSVYNALNTAVYNKFASGTALISLLGGTALYPEQAPNNAVLPYVVWNIQGGGDENQIAQRMKDLLLYARCYASSPGLAGSAAAQMDALMHGGSITVSGWDNFWLTSIRDVSLVESTPDNEQIYSVGAVYRIRLD